ncbi:DUF4135 domain-containing protein [Simkania sp.]|uniref:DUF4135 domain-containing protein n=1 Tax=Simkania sp. TaxID=34094 RepID=UPI003B51A790
MLPTIAHELELAKNSGLLKGSTSAERYHSFFIQNDQFTQLALELPKRYPFLFSQLDQVIKSAFNNLKRAIDRTTAMQSFSKITAIDLISHSDIHRGQQALLLTFSDKTQWVYKPRDLKPEKLLSRFIDHLNLEPSYQLKSPRVLSEKNYGWIEFQKHTPCHSKEEVQTYFARAGTLLAIADVLNFSDGHFENLIASGPYPILIDCETLFQSYQQTALPSKTIFSTGLLQKTAPNSKRKFYHSAFQAKNQETYHFLYPHVHEDRTDSLQVEFHGYREGILDNLPYIGEEYFSAQDFKEEFLRGLAYGYQAIKKASVNILADKQWWEALAQIEARTLMHHTVNYTYLLRRIQQPDAGKDKQNAEKLIKDKLPDTPYLSYEVADLLQGNIPYFYHFPNDTTLYDGNNTPYENFFQETATEQIKQNLQIDLGRKAIELVEEHLDYAKETFKCEPAKAS